MFVVVVVVVVVLWLCSFVFVVVLWLCSAVVLCSAGGKKRPPAGAGSGAEPQVLKLFPRRGRKNLEKN